MRNRSITGPLILIAIGAFFLWYNLNPSLPVWQLFSVYWPFLLIAWGFLRLVEVALNAIAARPLPRGISGGEVALIVLLCVCGSISFAAYHHNWRMIGPGRLELFGEQYDYPVSLQSDASHVTKVVLRDMRGNLRVHGADTTELRVSGQKIIRAMHKSDADRGDRQTNLQIFSEGDHLVLRGNVDRVSGLRVSQDLEITIPKSLGLEAHSRSGDIDVSNLAGNVDLSSDHADVRLSQIGGNSRVELSHSDLVRASDLKGNLDLQGRGSDLQLENISGQVTVNGSYSGTLSFRNLLRPLHFESPNTDFQVEKLPGQVSMDLGNLTGRNLVGPIRLKTRSKDVRIEDFTDSLDLETDRGDIALDPGRVPLAKIDARSRIGKIELSLPEKAAFALVATTEHGEVLNDFGPQIQRQTNGRAATLKGTVGQGPTIAITTQHGSVLVRKAGTDTEASQTGPPGKPGSGQAVMAPEKF